jgi:flagellar protein FlgJ
MQSNMLSSSVGHKSEAVYTDLNSLQSIRQLGKQDKQAALMEVAQQFESMFLNMMMASMRQAGDVFGEDSLMNSPETRFYQGMYDQQMALSLSGAGRGSAAPTEASGEEGIGLASVIYKQLLGNYSDGGLAERAAGHSVDQSQLFDRRIAGSFSTDEVQGAIHRLDQILAGGSLEWDSDPQKDAGLNATGERLVRDSVALVKADEHSDGALQGSNESRVQVAFGVQDRLSSRRSGDPEVMAGSKAKGFDSPEAFVAALYPYAQTVAKTLGVEPKAIVAQAALETGWGQHLIQDEEGNSSHNLFGIKADSRWSGDRVEVTTHEYRSGVMVKEKASFRAYDSLAEGLADYAAFLQSGSRYQDALGRNLAADQYGALLQQAGYATDPEYGAKIGRIANSDWLKAEALPSMPAQPEAGAPVSVPDSGSSERSGVFESVRE